MTATAATRRTPRPTEWYGRAVLEWDRSGKPTVVAKPRTPPPADPRLLHAGQLIDRSGDAWRVVRVTASAADVRCEVGRRAGEAEAISRSSAGHRFLTDADVVARREAAATSRATARDESRCPNCWAGEPGEVDGVDRGRDAGCADHRPTAEAVEKAKRGACGARREPDPPEVVERVLALRRAGKTYSQIESEMGWPDAHGARAWKIVKANPGAAPDPPKTRAAAPGRKKEK